MALQFSQEDLAFSTMSFPSITDTGFDLKMRLVALAEQGRLDVANRTAPLIHPNEFTQNVRVAQFLDAVGELHPQDSYTVKELHAAFEQPGLGHHFHPNLMRGIGEQRVFENAFKDKMEVTVDELRAISKDLFKKAAEIFPTTEIHERPRPNEETPTLRDAIEASFYKPNGYAHDYLDLEQVKVQDNINLGHEYFSQINDNVKTKDFNNDDLLMYETLNTELLKQKERNPNLPKWTMAG